MGWTLLGRVAHAAAQAGLIVLVARLGSARMVGELSLALALCSPVMVVAGLQLRVLYVTDVESRFSEPSYRRLRWWGSALGLGTLVVVAAVVPGDAAVPTVIVAVAIAKAVENHQDLQFAVYQRTQSMHRYGQSLLARSLLGLLALYAVLETTGSLALALASMGAAWWLVMNTFDRPRAAELRASLGHATRLSPGEVRALFWTALPLGAVIFVDSINQNVIRLIVDHAHGAQMLGYYAAMNYVVVAGGAVMFSLGAPMLPRLALQYAHGQRSAFARTTAGLVAMAAGLGGLGIAAAALLGEMFLQVVYAPDFADHAAAFVWIMGAGTLQFVLTMLMHAVNAARQRALQPLVYLAGFVVTVGLGVAWTPSGGLVGAAQASVGGWTVALLGACLLVVRSWRAMGPPTGSESR